MRQERKPYRPENYWPYTDKLTCNQIIYTDSKEFLIKLNPKLELGNIFCNEKNKVYSGENVYYTMNSLERYIYRRSGEAIPTKDYTVRRLYSVWWSQNSEGLAKRRVRDLPRENLIARPIRDNTFILNEAEFVDFIFYILEDPDGLGYGIKG